MLKDRQNSLNQLPSPKTIWKRLPTKTKSRYIIEIGLSERSFFIFLRISMASSFRGIVRIDQLLGVKKCVLPTHSGQHARPPRAPHGSVPYHRHLPEVHYLTHLGKKWDAARRFPPTPGHSAGLIFSSLAHCSLFGDDP